MFVTWEISYTYYATVHNLSLYRDSLWYCMYVSVCIHVCVYLSVINLLVLERFIWPLFYTNHEGLFIRVSFFNSQRKYLEFSWLNHNKWNIFILCCVVNNLSVKLERFNLFLNRDLQISMVLNISGFLMRFEWH